MKISMTSVFVDDPVKAHKFYTEVLGFQSVEYQEEAQLCVVASPEDPKGTALLLEPYGYDFARVYQEQLYRAGLPCIVLSASDSEAARKKLESEGVVFREDLEKPEWGITNVFEDTFGNLIMLENAG